MLSAPAVRRRDLLTRVVPRALAGGYFAIAAAATGGRLLGLPVGSAPFAIGPSSEPVPLTVLSGTEKQEWLTEAARQFVAIGVRAGGRPIQLKLDFLGSREIALRVARADSKPVVVTPASSIEIELLRDEWQGRYGTTPFYSGDDAPAPLVITPLVLVAWEERGNLLWPDGNSDWQTLRAMLADPRGWASRGHPEFGLVKFGHTSPLLSNSGVQTLVLLAYAHQQKSTNLVMADILDPDFQTVMGEFERGVIEFGDSTGTFMENMVRFGPSKYDVVAVYENLFVQNVDAARGRWGPIRIYYPAATILSDHPYAALDAPWVVPVQREAALLFRQFLLDRPMQEAALRFGFRPANTRVPLLTDDPLNPFNRYTQQGIRVQLPPSVATPPAAVMNALVDLWRRRVNR